MYHGIINVYKEAGLTSHDVVNRMRRILGQKKIGHTGTLDPQAEGVLPVCLGAGTKLCDMFADTTKEYRAVLHLGITTDTQDMTGTVLSTSPVTVDVEDVREACLRFIGTYEQLPPMYSAVKHNGKKLYQLARKGIEVERETRSVTINHLTVEEIHLPYVQMLVECSKGTYIRTLCEDIGNSISCGGCMESLVRTRVGDFHLDDALKLDQIAKLQEEGRLDAYIRSIDSFFMDLGMGVTLPEWDYFLRNGNALAKEQLSKLELRWQDAGEKKPVRNIRMYDSEGYFYGIYRWSRGRNQYRPEKIFITIQGK